MLENEVIDFYLYPHTGCETMRQFNISQTKLGKILTKYSVKKHSKETITRLSRQRAENTCLEKYGVKYPGGLNEFVNKAQKTNLEKYGVKAPLQNKSILAKQQQTCLNKFGEIVASKSEQIKEKIRCTNKDLYGVDWQMQRQTIKKQSKDTLISNFGVDCPAKSTEIQNKIKQTCIKKYGTDYALQAEIVKNKIKNTNLNKYGVEYPIQNDEILKKQQQTNYKKYNSLSVLTSERLKQYLINKYGVDTYTKTDEFLNIQYEIKKLNSSFNTSQSEEDFYLYLLKTHQCEDIVRQFFCEKYPFCCDFYIPSEDLFIELNLSWTHGKHPFDENNPEDIELLETWKEKAKTSKYYENAINTWTVRDVKKQKIAKENNLNYKVIYKDEWNEIKKEIKNEESH